MQGSSVAFPAKGTAYTQPGDGHFLGRDAPAWWDPVKVGAEPRSWDCVIRKLLCVGGNPVSARPACCNWIIAQFRAVGLCSGATLWGPDGVQGARVSSDCLSKGSQPGSTGGSDRC